MAVAIKPTTIRVNEALKAQASEILDSLGISYNNFVVMATHRLVNQRRIPFELLPALEVPNEATRRALVAAEAKELGLIPDDAVGFDGIDDLMTYLEDEE